MITTEQFGLAFISSEKGLVENEIDLRSTLIENDVLTFSFIYGGERWKEKFYLIDYISFCSNYAASSAIESYEQNK